MKEAKLKNDNKNLILVDSRVLPSVFPKVLEIKKMMKTGKAKTVTEAAAEVGISRSAFYKYKDLISPFNDMSLGHIITFSMLLRDEPGVLSGILAHFAESGANVLTIYQTIPSGGRAPVTISAETMGMKTNIDSFIERAMQIEGVISFGPLAGQ